MTNGEIAYLVLAIGAFLVYSGLLAYGQGVAAERPQPATQAQPGNTEAGSKKAA